jgi:uncharacterized protein VirK/YbjX
VYALFALKERSRLMLAVQRTPALIRNFTAILPLLLFRKNSPVGALIRRRPELLLYLATKPFISNKWTAKTRVSRLVDHCNTVATTGGVLEFSESESVEILSVNTFEGSYTLTLDQSPWLETEGLLTLGLRESTDRFFQLTFCIASQSGKLVAYIGGIQGTTSADALANHKRFTKRTYGMRPRDFLVEAFKMLCGHIGVQRIMAVSDSAHANHFKTSGWDPATPKLSYDEIWTERGGTPVEDGFYALPVSPTRRRTEQIPKRKASLYRKRYALLGRAADDLLVRVRQHEEPRRPLANRSRPSPRAFPRGLRERLVAIAYAPVGSLLLAGWVYLLGLVFFAAIDL